MLSFFSYFLENIIKGITMLDIYQGSLGAFVDKDKIADELNRYITQSQGSLAYEIRERNIGIVVITGKNETEDNVPLFEHPLIFTNVRGKMCVAIDLRSYMKNKLDNLVTLKEGLRDSYNGNMQVDRLIFTKLMAEDDDSFFNYMRPLIAETVANIVATNVAVLTFNESHKDIVKLITKLHMMGMDVTDSIPDTFDKYLELLPKREVGKFMSEDRDGYAWLKYQSEHGDFILPSRTLGDLVNNIKASFKNSTSAEGITSDVLIGVLSRGFYSLNSKYLSIAFVEHLPTAMAILMSVMSENVNSKSQFRKILNNNSKNVRPADLKKVLEEKVEDNLL